MLITGAYSRGWSEVKSRTMEVFNPYVPKICNMTDMPDSRHDHTVCGGLLCSARTCLKFQSMGFVKATVTLQQNRRDHLCWNVAQGILLLGGNDSSTTTELVVRDGSASMLKFNLMYPARSPS